MRNFRCPLNFLSQIRAVYKINFTTHGTLIVYRKNNFDATYLERKKMEKFIRTKSKLHIIFFIKNHKNQRSSPRSFLHSKKITILGQKSLKIFEFLHRLSFLGKINYFMQKNFHKILFIKQNESFECVSPTS